jgi:hypothetical protein
LRKAVIESTPERGVTPANGEFTLRAIEQLGK